MHPSTTPRRTHADRVPWFGNILRWDTPARPRFPFPTRSTHYAGRTYEVVKFTHVQAQHLGLRTNGWHFTQHPHLHTLPVPRGLGPALCWEMRSALMLAEAWLMSPRCDVEPDPHETVPDLLLALAGAGPTFHLRGRLMTLWPRPEEGCVGLHGYSEHLTERGPELGTLTPQFDLSDCPGAEQHGLRWRPRLSPSLGGNYMQSSLYWRDAVSTLADYVIGKLPR